jgi:hypothetical protein
MNFKSGSFDSRLVLPETRLAKNIEKNEHITITTLPFDISCRQPIFPLILLEMIEPCRCCRKSREEITRETRVGAVRLSFHFSYWAFWLDMAFNAMPCVLHPGANVLSKHDYFRVRCVLINCSFSAAYAPFFLLPPASLWRFFCRGALRCVFG